MYFCRVVRNTCSKNLWYDITNTLLEKLKSAYDSKKHGLDLSKSGFLRSEVYKADECVYIIENKEILGFVFVLTNKRPRTLYITLMVSFQKGIGREIIHHLEKTPVYAHELISLRATRNSIGFYIKLHFLIFDFITMETYVNGSVSNMFTDEIKNNLKDDNKLCNIQKSIVDVGWMPYESDEFPMLKKRKCEHLNINENTRRSKRLMEICT